MNNFKSKHFSSYSKNSSSSNLHRHLKRSHEIDIQKVCPEKQRKIHEIFEMQSPSSSSTTQKQLQESKKKKIEKEIALWMSNDILSFDIIDGSGFQDFLKNTGTLKANDDFLNSSDIENGCLNELYNDSYQKLVKILEENIKDYCAISIETWTDRHSAMSYMTLVVHFITEDMVPQNFTLKTCIIQPPHTPDYLAKQIKKVLAEFSLQNKRVTFVTDEGRSILKAIELLGHDRQSCLAQNIHHLVSHDVLNDECMNTMNEIMSKLKHIYRTLIKNKADLEAQENAVVNKEIWQSFSQDFRKVCK